MQCKQHTQPGIPAHYTLVSAWLFASAIKTKCGFFVGAADRRSRCDTARAGLTVLAACYPQGHFLPFFEGMLALRAENFAAARHWFLQAAPVQPEAEAQALALFYAGYTHTLQEQWAQAQPLLEQAFALCPEMKEYGNLNGVALFKMQRYAQAAQVFEAVLKIDKGSVMDIANLGLCYSHVGNIKAAKHHLQAALAIDPSLDFARRALDALA